MLSSSSVKASPTQEAKQNKSVNSKASFLPIARIVNSFRPFGSPAFTSPSRHANDHNGDRDADRDRKEDIVQVLRGQVNGDKERKDWTQREIQILTNPFDGPDQQIINNHKLDRAFEVVVDRAVKQGLAWDKVGIGRCKTKGLRKSWSCPCFGRKVLGKFYWEQYSGLSSGWIVLWGFGKLNCAEENSPFLRWSEEDMVIGRTSSIWVCIV